MIGAGIATAGAILAPALSSVPAAAAAPQAGAQAPGFYRTKVGSIGVTCLLDGGMTLGDDLMLKAREKDLKRAKVESFIAEGKEFPAYVNAFLINTGKKVTLVDTGGKGMAPGLGNLQSNLKAAGVSAAQVDEIIITHAHPDHTNGLLDDKGRPAFAKAKVRIAAEELDFWFNAENAAKFADKKMMFDLARKNLGPYKDAGRIETFAADADLGGGLSAVALPGHTPGHSGVRVSDGSEQLLIWGDIIHVPALQFEHPDISIAFDLDPDQARATRKAILDEVASDRIRIAGMHLVFPAAGYAVPRGTYYKFVPQAWEINV